MHVCTRVYKGVHECIHEEDIGGSVNLLVYRATSFGIILECSLLCFHYFCTLVVVLYLKLLTCECHSNLMHD